MHLTQPREECELRELNGRSVEITQAEIQGGGRSRDRDRTEHPRTSGPMELHKGEERANEAEELFEGITAEDLPKIMKTKPEIQDALRTPSGTGNKENTLRDSMVKNKERTLKAATGKNKDSHR